MIPLEKSTWLRRLRGRFRISLRELEAASGLSNQYISSVELGRVPPSQRLEERVYSMLEAVIDNRKKELLVLEAECRAYRGRLLEIAEDESNEQ